MSGGDGNVCPWCPFRVTRKNIVMTIMCLCCFALVAWTVIITGDPTANAPRNVSLVFVDDSKTIENLNFTLSSVLAVDAMSKAQDKKMSAVKNATEKALANKKTALRNIREPGGPHIDDQDRATLCKCICGLNVTADDMLAALMYIVESRKQGFGELPSTSTTTTTTPPPWAWR